MFAVTTLEQVEIDRLPGFKRRMQWFIEHRPDLCGSLESHDGAGLRGSAESWRWCRGPSWSRLLERMLDEDEFLSPHGIRSVSRYHKDHPLVVPVDGQEYRVDYEPAESTSGLFGGNSNWRGPVWFPINYLMIESLQRFAYHYGDELKVDFPTGSGNQMNLADVAKNCREGCPRYFCGITTADALCSAKTSGFKPIPISGITFLLTSTFTATTAAASARAIKRGGPLWSPTPSAAGT